MNGIRKVFALLLTDYIVLIPFKLYPNALVPIKSPLASFERIHDAKL